MVAGLLPTCRETSRLNTGTGTIVAIDYLHPSYWMLKQEVVEALGQPDRWDQTDAYYKLGELTNGMVWDLSVHFHSNYVTGSTLYGSLKESK